MKYNTPKHFNQGGFNHVSEGGKLSKRAWLIIALAVLVTIVAVIVIVSVVKKQQEETKIEAAELQKLEVKEIQIGHAPNKRVYYCGTSLDTTGLIVYSVTHGGKFTELDLDACTITGFDSSVPVKEQTVTVTYKGFTATFTVEIKAEPTETLTLVSIAMQNLPKTQYKVKEGLDCEGGTLVCTYSDGSTKTVDLINEYIYGFRAAYLAGVGEYDITVKYEENGVQVETTYKITITE